MRWFGHYDDADLVARDRADLHTQRVEHHSDMARRRSFWLMIFLFLAAVAIAALVQAAPRFTLVGVVCTAIGVGVGGALISVVHHLRKISYHKFRASSE
jgi:hypothetical protein